MSLIVSLNFEITPVEKAFVPVMDRSFLYGDSVYEAIRTYRSKHLFLLERHYARMLKSAARIGMTVPFSEAEIRKHLEECVGRADHGDSYIRIVVSRGTDYEFDLGPRPDLKATTVCFVAPIHVYPRSYFEEGIRVSLVSIRRNHPSAVDPNIKTGNYMNNMMALMEARGQGSQDAIMLNQADLVTEATTANLFIVKEGVVFTPEVESGLLEGVSRKLLLEVMEKENVPYRARPIPRELFLGADEVFLTGTTKEIMPVTRVDDARVGDGKPGPVTRKLMGMFSREVERIVGAA